VTIESELGQGTRVRIALPAVTPAPASAPAYSQEVRT
jgi:signal transduction histidine kinase